jgi:hypothetical protein
MPRPYVSPDVFVQPRCLPAALALLLTIILAACDNAAPTLTPTRVLSAPTLEASATVLPLMQEREPTLSVNAGQNDPTAAALPRDSELPPLESTLVPGETRQSIAITAPDGTQMQGDLYASATGERSPAILMLAPDRGAWLDLPLRLQARGFSVIAMNATAGSSNLPTGEFGAMLQALSQLSSVDPGRIAVVGAEGGADAALTGCAADLLCDALVLLSPTDAVGAENAMLRYNPRPIFLAAGEGDPGLSVIARLRDAARGTVGYETVAGSARGTGLITAQPALGDAIIDWLEAQLP